MNNYPLTPVTKSAIVLDSNIFIHYKPILEPLWHWRTVAAAKSIDLIVIARAHVELNLIKDGGTSRALHIRQRAGDALAKIGNWAAQPNQRTRRDKNGVRVIVELDDPPDSCFVDGLTKATNDSYYVAAARQLVEQGQYDRVMICSADHTVGLIGRSAKHRCIMLKPEETLKREEPEVSLEQRQIAELTATVSDLTNARPKPILVFENDQLHFEFSVPSVEVKPQVERDKELQMIVDSFAPMPIVDENGREISEEEAIARGVEKAVFLAREMTSVPQTRVRPYIAAYRRYLEQDAEFEIQRGRSFEVKIWIRNEGTAEATNIDVVMQFPDYLLISTAGGAPKRPQKPDRPQPGYFGSPLADAYPGRLDSIGSRSVPPQPNVGRPQIEGGCVVVTVQTLRHHLKAKLAELYLTFKPGSEVAGFSVPCKIGLRELPKQISHELHFNLHPS